MIKLLTKIEQDYGLPVAISFAKQAIKQNYLRTETLRKSDKAEVVTSNIITVTIDTMQKILKEPKMTMIAPFNKGNLNIKGIIHQAAKGIKDARATNTTHRCN